MIFSLPFNTRGFSQRFSCNKKLLEEGKAQIAIHDIASFGINLLRRNRQNSRLFPCIGHSKFSNTITLVNEGVRKW